MMPVIVEFENGEPTGWRVAPSLDHLFRELRASLGDDAPVVQWLYQNKDYIDMGISPVPDRKIQILPGTWLLMPD